MSSRPYGLFNSNPLQAWGELYESGLHSDITFLVGPMKRSFPAHKLVLSTHSSTFAAMLYNGMEESSASTITLADHDAGVFECLLNYMYTGQVKMHKDHVRKLIRLADYYAVDVLRENVGEWIGRTLIDKNNVCEYIVFAADHNVHSLHKHCYRFMLGNAKDIFFSREFRDSIPYEILEKMVVSDDLNLTEIELFESLLKWGVSKVQISPYNNMGMKKSVAQSTDGDGEGSESSDHHSSDDDVHPSRSSRGNSLLSLRDLETEAFTPEYSKALRLIFELLEMCVSKESVLFAFANSDNKTTFKLCTILYI